MEVELSVVRETGHHFLERNEKLSVQDSLVAGSQSGIL